MKEIKTPFSSFDLFSNIIPAITFCVGLCFILSFLPAFVSITPKIQKEISSYLIAEKKTSNEKSSSEKTPLIEKKDQQAGDDPMDHYKINFLAYTLILSSLTAILLVIGHILMSFGTLYIDRLILGKGIGYPYFHLLEIQPTKSKEASLSFSLSFSLLPLLYLLIIIWLPWLVLSLFFVFHFLFLFFAKIIITKIKSDEENRIRENIPSKEDQKPLIEINIDKYCNRVKKLSWISITYFLLKPALNFFKNILNMKPFNDEFIFNFRQLFLDRFKLDINKIKDIDASVFWLCYSDVHENQNASSQSLQTIRSLFYLSRNLCISFLLLFIICSISQLASQETLFIKTLGTICLFFSIIFFVHFYNIYFTYYSKQTFRSFYAYHINPKKK